MANLKRNSVEGKQTIFVLSKKARVRLCLFFLFLIFAGINLNLLPLTITSSAPEIWLKGDDQSPSVSPKSPSEAIREKVDGWLRQLPAASQEEADRIFFEMLKGGSPVVEELCRRLAAPGEADDSLVRYAVDGLVVQVGKPGFETHKKKLAEDLLRFALRPVNMEIKKFLLEEMQFIASQKHLSLLRPHLRNPELAEYAVKTMLRVKGPELEKILVEDLDRIPPQARKPVIQALGMMKSRSAVKKLRALAGSDDTENKFLALTALAEIADPATEPLLASVSTLSSQQEKRQAVELYLRFARRLAEDGRKEPALRIARKALRTLVSPDEIALRSEALALLIDILGEKSTQDIIAMLQDENKEFRKQALKLAGHFNWPRLFSALREKLPELNPEVKAEVIEFFGEKKDASLAEVVAPYLNSDDQSIRLAAIRAFYNSNRQEALEQLIPMLNNSEAEARLILELLKTYPPASYTNKLIELFSGLSETIKVAVLQSLQEIIQPQWKSLIFAACESESAELKKAATDCLVQVVDPKDLTWLIEKLTALDDPALGPGYQKAVVAALKQIPEADLRQKSYLEFLEKKTGKARAELIKLLPRVGGSECLKKAVNLINDKNPEISGAAVAAVTGWPEFEATPTLVNLIKTSSDRKVRYLAFQGLARLVRESGVDKEEKIRVLQEIKSLATYPDEKNFLLAAWGSVRDIRALRELANFLADENLKDRAAGLICRLARPVAGEEGLQGLETIMILKKAAALLKDNLEIEETEIYLDKLLRQEGFEPLFNRKDLYGWKGLVGDPVKRARMSPEELAAEQKKADEEMRQHWRVVDGVLVFDGKGHNLCTVKDYCDFELFVDWKIEPGGDSGIYLRGSPQVQIWDPAQWPEGSGGLYNNQKNPNKPLKQADNPVGTWNTFYIKMVGDKVTVYLNGELVVDNVVMENYWERDKPIYRCGQIELQAHNTPLYFKNIYIREIK
ncbi:MAG: DUF1080 domain-containing protein [Candidatus Aminicenantes bacterium]|nr:DUF1080 domain-containing protein [Candidatus Aminicenantes bacterium]